MTTPDTMDVEILLGLAAVGFALAAAIAPAPSDTFGQFQPQRALNSRDFRPMAATDTQKATIKTAIEIAIIKRNAAEAARLAVVNAEHEHHAAERSLCDALVKIYEPGARILYDGKVYALTAVAGPNTAIPETRLDVEDLKLTDVID